MSTYIVQGRWTLDAIRRMLAHPEDRAEALKKAYDAAGAKLISYYVTFGEYDFIIVAESSDEKAVLSGLIVGAAGGAVTNLKTTLAFTSAEAKQAFEAAKGLVSAYKPPGA